jgi:hypothetical protein
MLQLLEEFPAVGSHIAHALAEAMLAARKVR